jgi:hypothetical protein
VKLEAIQRQINSQINVVEMFQGEFNLRGLHHKKVLMKANEAKKILE